MTQSDSNSNNKANKIGKRQALIESSLAGCIYDDERRWQRYLETGNALSFQTVRHKLRRLAGRDSNVE